MAACAGIIVFGSLMGAMFIGQQFLQNVLGYSTLDAGASILPAAVLHGARRAALGQARRAPRARASRCWSATCFCLLGFLTMLLLWKDGIPYWKVGLGYALRRGSASASPARRRRTRSPGRCRCKRAGMASGTADLQRDLGGAIMQSILGALLTAGYAAAFARAIAGSPHADAGQQRHAGRADEVVRERRRRSPSSTRSTPTQIIDGRQDLVRVRRRTGPTRAGIVAVLLGAALVFFRFPKHDEEQALLAEYHAEDTAPAPAA